MTVNHIVIFYLLINILSVFNNYILIFGDLIVYPPGGMFHFYFEDKYKNLKPLNYNYLYILFLN